VGAVDPCYCEHHQGAGMTVVSLQDRRTPVYYTVRIAHHWDGKLEIFVEDVADDERSRQSIADALDRASKVFRRRG